MNQFWITGNPGSGYHLIEALIRFCSGLDFDKNLQPPEALHCFHRHHQTQSLIPTMELQDNRSTLQQLVQPIDNNNPRVVTVTAPMAETGIDAVFNIVKDRGHFIFLNAQDPVFGIVFSQTSSNDPRKNAISFMPNNNVKQWNSEAEVFTDLERWEQREYLSSFIEHYWTELESQRQLAMSYGATCYFTESFMTDPDRVCRAVFEKFEIPIADEQTFDVLIELWKHHCTQTISDYQSINSWKHALVNESEYDSQIPLRSLVYEAIIQRHIRTELNTELRCAGLNTWPTTVRELKEYYD